MKKDKKVINQNLEKSQEELLTQEKEQEEQISFLEKNRKGLKDLKLEEAGAEVELK